MIFTPPRGWGLWLPSLARRRLNLMLQCGSQGLFVQCNMTVRDHEPVTESSATPLLRRIGASGVYLSETSVKSC